MLTEEWMRALDLGDDRALRYLAQTEYPGTTVFQIVFFIMRQLMGVWKGDLDQNDRRLRERIERALFVREQVRSWYCWYERRQFDLECLAEFYRSKCVIPIVGAGASIAADGPSWPRLVEQLLLTVLEPERQCEIPIPKRNGGWYFLKSKSVLHFDPNDEEVARRAITAIRNGTADTESLMEAAQLCANLFQHQFFSWVTPILYLNCPGPGPIYRAIAELAFFSDRPELGWETIVTYNFDNLMGEALEKIGCPYSILTVKNGVGIMTVPSDHTDYTEIIHLHGYVARELMKIDGIQYVLSTSQYEELYGDKKSALLNTLRLLLKKPDLFAFYIGCSFTDDAMNRILRETSTKRPGDYHYALLQIPERLRDEEEIDEKLLGEERRYLDMGVQPVWFREFEDIPNLIRQLS